MIGGDGLTEAVFKETDGALRAHGLIKIRVLAGERPEREAMLAALAERLNAAPIQHIGKLLVLWRPLPEKPQPSETGAKPVRSGKGSRQVKLVNFTQAGSRPTIKTVTVHGNQRVTAGGHIKRARTRSVSPKKRAG